MQGAASSSRMPPPVRISSITPHTFAAVAKPGASVIMPPRTGAAPTLTAFGVASRNCLAAVPSEAFYAAPGLNCLTAAVRCAPVRARETVRGDFDGEPMKCARPGE